jgi:hypothetical protein
MFARRELRGRLRNVPICVPIYVPIFENIPMRILAHDAANG